jgi:hypothetical protein
MNPDERFDLLWTDFLEGDLDAEGMADLQSLLAHHSHLQEKAANLLQTHRLLGFVGQEECPSAEAFAREVLNRLPKTGEVFIGAVMRDLKPAPTSLPRFPWLSWHPLTAAAAGIVFGMLCTTVVLGFGARSVEKVVSLLQESFESGPAPQVTGVPSGPDLWSGDYSEIVMEFEDAKPEDGSRMARLLRSDYEGRTVPRPSRQGDLMRVLDVRPYLTDAKSADVVMTLSAQFNAAPFPDTERYDGMVTIYALGADAERRGATEDSVKEDALAFSIGECRNVDRDAGTWQAASTRLLLPPGTESVMVKVSFRRMPLGAETLSSLPESLTFAGHFVDEVRASVRMIAHRTH